jgi:hypothetical protein
MIRLNWNTTRGVIFVSALLLLNACSQNPEHAIAGAWNVSEISSDVELPNYNISDFHFEFYPNGSYQYTGNMYYREAGRFSINSGYLYTTDTLLDGGSEKAVQIIKLSRDSLVLRMANETVMRMVRQKKEK